MKALKLILMIVMVGVLAACATAPTATPIPTPALPEGIRPVDPPIVLSNFTLTDQDGKPATLESWRGKYQLVVFGFTNCPDVCPVTLASWVAIRRSLGADADKIGYQWVSVDGKRDTPEVIKAKLALFDPAIGGLTGDEGLVRIMAREFGATFKAQEPDADGRYNIDHTASSFLVDAEGRLVRIYSYDAVTQRPDVVAEDIRGWLK